MLTVGRIGREMRCACRPASRPANRLLGALGSGVLRIRHGGPASEHHLGSGQRHAPLGAGVFAITVLAYVVMSGAPALAQATTIDTYSWSADETAVTQCVDGQVTAGDNQDNSAPGDGAGPFTLHLPAASPQPAHTNCPNDAGSNATASATSTLDAVGSVDATSGVLTLDFTDQGSGTATVNNPSGSRCAQATTIEDASGLVDFTITVGAIQVSGCLVLRAAGSRRWDERETDRSADRQPDLQCERRWEL